MPTVPSKRVARSDKGPRAFLKKPVVWVIVLSVFGLLMHSSGEIPTYDLDFLKGVALGSFDPIANSQKMQEWTTKSRQACTQMMEKNQNKDTPTAREEKEALEREALSGIEFPSFATGSLPSDHQPYQYCRNVFIDLGTNIGDSIGYFVDSALDVCTATWMEALPKTKLNQDFPRPHLDVSTLEMVHKGAGSNPLYGMLQQHMRKDPSAPVSPHSFCVYGMEGNPEFTDRLQKLENYVMKADPRPVRHLHIHTESVVTAVDGLSKLFLDKTSVEQNVSEHSMLVPIAFISAMLTF